MADFQTSTHRAKWIFSPQQLVEKYRAANQRAKQILEKCGATLMEVDVDGSLSYPEPHMTAKDSAEKHYRTKPLSIEEEQCIKVFYENKLQEVYNNFRFPHKIQIELFHRLTCVYAACKIEENHVSAEELGKGISQDHQMILNNEMIVYQSLEFDLIVYAPYRSVEGFINDVEEFCNAGDDQLEMLKLALAALSNSNALHRVIDFDSYLRGIFSHENSMHTMSELSESLNAIDSWVRKYKSPSEKELKHINRKLKSCWGHSSHDEGKKREKKSKHKSKKSSNEAQNMSSLA